MWSAELGASASEVTNRLAAGTRPNNPRKLLKLPAPFRSWVSSSVRTNSVSRALRYPCIAGASESSSSDTGRNEAIFLTGSSTSSNSSAASGFSAPSATTEIEPALATVSTRTLTLFELVGALGIKSATVKGWNRIGLTPGRTSVCTSAPPVPGVPSTPSSSVALTSIGPEDHRELRAAGSAIRL